MSAELRLGPPIRMRLTGSGTPDDPWRPPVPTGAIVSIEGEDDDPPSLTGYGMVRVLTDDAQMLTGWAPGVDAAGRAVSVPQLEPLPEKPSDEHHARWHAWLDTRYAEHAGRFRPRVLSD